MLVFIKLQLRYTQIMESSFAPVISSRPKRWMRFLPLLSWVLTPVLWLAAYYIIQTYAAGGDTISAWLAIISLIPAFVFISASGKKSL